jgi:hypothetical protein
MNQACVDDHEADTLVDEVEALPQNSIDSFDDPYYERFIDQLITFKKKLIVDSRTPAQSRIIIRKLLTEFTPDKYIGIYSGILHKKGFDQKAIIKSINKHLSNGIEIRIILQARCQEDPPLPTNNPKRPILKLDKFKKREFYKNVIAPNLNNENLVIKTIKKEFWETHNHIITVNNSAFRLEYDDKDTHSIAAFYNSDKGQKIRVFFEDLWLNKSEKLDLNK